VVTVGKTKIDLWRVPSRGPVGLGAGPEKSAAVIGPFAGPLPRDVTAARGCQECNGAGPCLADAVAGQGFLLLCHCD
jgi:hypothetical protein